MYTLKDPIFFTAVLTAVSLAAIFIFLGWMVVKSQRRYFLQRQQACTQELHTLKQERLRIAKDLHDELGSLLQITFQQVALIANKKGELQDVALSAKDMLEVIMRRTTEIARNMDDHRILKAGLQKSIEKFISQHSLARQLYFQFRYGLTKEPPPLVAAGLYRILLELVNNTIKHAGATIAFITFRQQNNILYFHYADNGNGFNLSAMQEAEGSGLRNLQQRVSLLGGRLETQTCNGASFLISIPLR